MKKDDYTKQDMNQSENQNGSQNANQDAGHGMKWDSSMMIASLVAFIPVIVGLILWFVRPEDCGVIYGIVLGKTVGSAVLVRGMLGVVFMALGNYLPKCKQNNTIGVRVKWTLESEENWNKTHRFAGKVWLFTGLLILGTMFTPFGESSVVFLVLALIMSLAPVAYSYCFYRKQLKAGKIGESGMKNKHTNQQSKKAVGILVTILFLVVAMLVLVTGKFQVEVGTSALKIDATFWDDATIAYDDMTDISYKLQDDAGSRTFGYGTPSLLMGEFENQEFGSYTRYSYPSCQACIVITANGKIIVINGKNEEETKSLYENLLKAANLEKMTESSDVPHEKVTVNTQNETGVTSTHPVTQPKDVKAEKDAEAGTDTETGTEASSDTISIVMVGDILLHTPVEKSALNAQGMYDFTPIFAEVKEDISGADLALVNQEVIIGGEELGVSGYPAFNAPYPIADALVDAGFDVICQATNHAMDKGKKGILNDLAYWESHYPDMVVTGIQDREEEWQQITTVCVGDVTLAILNYTYGTNGIALPSDMPYAVNLLQEEKVKQDLQMAEQIADFTIVCPHWGTEYQLTPSKEQEKWKNIFLEGGADLVIGTHPHVIEPVEMVSDGENHMLVYYSLGNFVNWTSGKGTGVANRMVGGMAQIQLKKENDKVVIKEYGVKPLVTHVEEGYGGVKTYALSDYSETLGEANLIRKQDSTFSFAYAQELCQKVWGDLQSLTIEE